MSSDDQSTDPTLPSPAPTQSEQAFEPRPYVEIRPTETAVDPTTVTQAMAQCCSLLSDQTQTGLLDRLRGTTEQPRIEWLLVSDGHSDPTLRWLVSTTHPELEAELETIVRAGLPDTYEIREVEFHPRELTASAQPHTPTESTQPEPTVAGVEYRGETTRRRDWTTPLTPFTEHTERRHPSRRDRETTTQTPRVPLTRLIETIRSARTPVCYQVVIQHHPEWMNQAEAHLLDLEEGTVTAMDRLIETLSPRTSEQRQDYRPAHEDRKRIEAIEQRDTHHGVRLSARAVAFADSPQTDELLGQLPTALTSLDGPFHRVRGHTHTDDKPAQTLFEDLCARTVHSPSYDSPRTYLPGTTPESRGIVVTADELPGFCLVNGARLTPDAQRALTTRPTERTGITLPPPTQLAQYQPPGMALCRPLNHDREPIDQPLFLSPDQQKRHLVVVGGSGAGKSVVTEIAMLTNTQATDGPAICLDYKGGGTAEEYARIHDAEYGSLEDVQYFDLSRVLPALSFFDIEPLLEAGIPREEARSRKVGHYEEILKGVLGAEKYGEAAESVKVIRNHLRALYDPIHGRDAPAHCDLYEALLRTQRGDGMPATADEQLTNYFN